jgi:Cytochrome C oxidase, cbb3-type, subunit III
VGRYPLLFLSAAILLTLSTAGGQSPDWYFPPQAQGYSLQVVAVEGPTTDVSVSWDSSLSGPVDLEYSSDLSSWTTLSTNNTAGFFLHEEGKNAKSGFYRLLILDLNFVRLDQGANWASRDWNTFYTTDQGSRIMPYSWMKALREPNGAQFLRNSMTRYGFLPNAKSVSNPEGLPVGFLVAAYKTSTPTFSMTCAACHTRELTVNETRYRIDGGPGFINMHAFMKDMVESVAHLLTNEIAFGNFQQTVQTPSAELRTELQRWYALNNLVVGQALPQQPWGIARLDALNLILNRSTGGSIGEPSANYLIPGNVAVADKPVRFPFLWNSDRQDLTQWAGTTVNGNKEYAMSRNAGEVCGVFGVLHPVGGRPPTDFLAENSINYDGLAVIGDLTPKIGPPTYAWPIDGTQANRGREIYELNCAECHGIHPGSPRPPVTDTWRTPVQKVHTDTYYWETFNRTASSSGVLTGFVFGNKTVAATGEGSLFLSTVLSRTAVSQKFPGIDLSINSPTNHVFGSYESRVLQGIWAAAPYLHNGSVPTLAELLKPPAERVTSFKVGPNYDLENIGLATNQPIGYSVHDTTKLGNSNAGHNFGTDLPDSDKEALLEYIRGL